MKTFKIEIQEFLSRVVEIEADNINDAFLKVNEKYKKSEIVLDYNDFVEVDFIDMNSQIKNDEKNKLINEVIDYLFTDEKKHFEELNEPENHIFFKINKIKRNGSYLKSVDRQFWL